MSENTGAQVLPMRQHRAVRTDEVILNAAVHVASDEGWIGLTPGHLAEVIGLSRPTVLQRHVDRAAVGAAAWHHIAPTVRSALTRLLDLGTATTISDAQLKDALHPFTHPDDTMRAAAELFIVAGYVPEVGVAVAETLGADFTTWFTAGRTPQSRASAARRAFLFGMAMGFVLESRRLGGIDVDLDHDIDRLARALTTSALPVRLPTTPARHFDEPIAFATGDPTWDAVLRATLECVGEFGYEASTIEVIAARSGYTRTAIFTRYPTKQDLFMDASDRMLSAAAQANIDYQVRIGEKYGPGIPDTCFLREVIKPDRHRLRNITLEQVRLAAHSERLQVAVRESAAQFADIMSAQNPDLTSAQVNAKLITELAISTGLAALAQVSGLIWNLPYDVILVPWRLHEADQA